MAEMIEMVNVIATILSTGRFHCPINYIGDMSAPIHLKCPGQNVWSRLLAMNSDFGIVVER